MHDNQPKSMIDGFEALGRPTGVETISRTRYEKPTLLVIPLVADEVLAVGCKLDGGGPGPIGISCTASACQAEGS